MKRKRNPTSPRRASRHNGFWCGGAIHSLLSHSPWRSTGISSSLDPILSYRTHARMRTHSLQIPSRAAIPAPCSSSCQAPPKLNSSLGERQREGSGVVSAENANAEDWLSHQRPSSTDQQTLTKTVIATSLFTKVTGAQRLEYSWPAANELHRRVTVDKGHRIIFSATELVCQGTLAVGVTGYKLSSAVVQRSRMVSR